MKVETVLETARAQIGYREGANNNNIYGKEYGLNNQPWCVIFLWWCFKHSLDGQTEKLSDFMPNSAHCNGVRSFALGIDRWYPRSEIGLHVNIEVGDLVVWDNNGDNSGDHIGIVESVTNNNHFTTIEGNHADAVARVNRTFANVMGVYKPLYDFDFRAAELNNLTGAPAIDKDALQDKNGNINADVDNVNADVDVPEMSPQGDTLLSMGAQGRAVSILQYALHMHGCEPKGSRKFTGDYDGEWGEGTQNALDRFTGHINSTCTEEVWKELLK